MTVQELDDVITLLRERDQARAIAALLEQENAALMAALADVTHTYQPDGPRTAYGPAPCAQPGCGLQPAHARHQTPARVLGHFDRGITS